MGGKLRGKEMDQKQRIAMQRAKVREAIGILHGVTELFGVEDSAVYGVSQDFEKWSSAVHEFEKWAFDQSPIA